VVTTLSMRRSFPAGVGPPALPGLVIREGTPRSHLQTQSTTSGHTPHLQGSGSAVRVAVNSRAKVRAKRGGELWRRRLDEDLQ
jgi:hypothetical protein